MSCIEHQDHQSWGTFYGHQVGTNTWYKDQVIVLYFYD